MLNFLLYEIILCELYLNLKRERLQGRKNQGRKSNGNTGQDWPGVLLSTIDESLNMHICTQPATDTCHSPSLQTHTLVNGSSQIIICVCYKN